MESQSIDLPAPEWVVGCATCEARWVELVALLPAACLDEPASERVNELLDLLVASAPSPAAELQLASVFLFMLHEAAAFAGVELDVTVGPASPLPDQMPAGVSMN